MNHRESTNPAPLVSIAVPLYNGRLFIRGCLDNLAAQTFKDYEIVIIDNGSNDGSSAICQEYAAKDSRIRYHRFEGTIPIAKNFWRAFEHCRGKYFTWNSADDRRLPDMMAAAVAELEKHPEAVMCHGPIEVDIVADGTLTITPNDFDASMDDAAARVAAFTRGVQHNGTYFSLYRREALKRVQLEQVMGHDFLVPLQMAMIGPMRRIDVPITRYWHVFGPIDHPMYGYRPLSVRKLLSWPEHRFKCWMSLVRGSRYLLQERGTPLATRVHATSAYGAAFFGRFGGYLFRESVYALAAPIAVVLWPLSEPVRMLRRAWLARRGPQSAASH